MLLKIYCVCLWYLVFESLLTGVRLGGARRNHAVVEKLVVQSVGEAGRFVLVNRHGRIIGEVGIVQHLEHFVASNLSILQKNQQFIIKILKLNYCKILKK